MDTASNVSSASIAVGAIRDITGSQVITKTLDKLNTMPTLSGPQVDVGYQFQKDVLGTAGIGRTLDMTV